MNENSIVRPEVIDSIYDGLLFPYHWKIKHLHSPALRASFLAVHLILRFFLGLKGRVWDEGTSLGTCFQRLPKIWRKKEGLFIYFLKKRKLDRSINSRLLGYHSGQLCSHILKGHLGYKSQSALTKSGNGRLKHPSSAASWALWPTIPLKTF